MLRNLSWISRIAQLQQIRDFRSTENKGTRIFEFFFKLVVKSEYFSTREATGLLSFDRVAEKMTYFERPFKFSPPLIDERESSLFVPGF